MSTKRLHSINAPPLIAIFPLHGRYPHMAIGLALQNEEQAQAATKITDISIVAPLDANWSSASHWFNEDTKDNASIFDLDAYSDFFSQPNENIKHVYDLRMNPTHIDIFESIWKTCNHVSNIKFKRLPLPGSMTQHHEDAEVEEASKLKSRRQSSGLRLSLREQFESPLATPSPSAENYCWWADAYTPTKLRGRADAEA